MALNLDNLINDYNGSVLLSPGTAEWGYVDQQWYLQIPSDANLNQLNAHVAGQNPFGDQLNLRSFLKANYHALAANNALNNPDKALFGAFLRAHVATLGAIDGNLNRRGVIENEYIVRAHLGNNWVADQNGIPLNNNATAIVNYVKKFGDTILQMLVYVFSARGHHWQDEFDALYDRLFNACSIPKPATWAFPSNKEIFKYVLHAFGIRIPLEIVNFCKENNRMINPMRLRFSPHAPVAGASQVTTLKAVLLEMQSEAWWNTFRAKFNNAIMAIDNEVTAIARNPYDYHVASRVLTGNVKSDLSVAAIQAFVALAQYAIGYIDYLGRRHSLSGQKVITQKSGGPKAIADAFSRACDRLGKPNVNVVDMATFINAL